jgi:CheY-like chemotaxis protein
VTTILIVEDNKLVRIANERLLTKAGYCVIGVGDGEQALSIAARDQPDVILLDMMLPKLSGHQVLAGLKSNPVTARIPVIVVTALSQKNESKLRSDGASAFVGKGETLDNPRLLEQAVIEALAAENRALPFVPVMETPVLLTMGE